jgi:hypothetical protein
LEIVGYIKVESSSVKLNKKIKIKDYLFAKLKRRGLKQIDCKIIIILAKFN